VKDRLAAIDHDSTLLPSDRTISELSPPAIAAAAGAGIEVVVVTARAALAADVVTGSNDDDGVALLERLVLGTVSRSGARRSGRSRR
jgi:hydroxymethylpyrimidine pyrophosphatase-like HAD family hydrolase